MYKIVENLEEANVFNQIWMECWLEKGFEFEFSKGLTELLLIKNQNNMNVGTIEVKSYNLKEKNNINQVFPFYKLKTIQQYVDQTAELDKAAILKEHRGENLDRLITSLAHFAEQKEIKYCVALLEGVFCKALRRVYKMPMEVVGEKIFYKGDYVIPAIIHIEKLYKDKKDYSWLMKQWPGLQLLEV
ncbi:hypothetical protein F9802_06625 [Bacillus aerolatus]|uniref:GNAT family N-acetyltransferase n=1 Tax=Bacillus aerolatus TaxID=2653354 RepID=A0A6I1FGS5_9BACI|nr:hypothetical protein [Bacillus aerolatus]KAB7707422.1 hypothetical protein F9802_06625 [Bacillus aerolatus]